MHFTPKVVQIFFYFVTTEKEEAWWEVNSSQEAHGGRVSIILVAKFTHNVSFCSSKCIIMVGGKSFTSPNLAEEEYN